MTDPTSHSTDLALELHMGRMGMAGDLAAGAPLLLAHDPSHVIAEARSTPRADGGFDAEITLNTRGLHEFSAAALRQVVARLQAENLEGDPRAWDRAADLLAEAAAVVDGARKAQAHQVGGC